jgi:hypothetical protein
MFLKSYCIFKGKGIAIYAIISLLKLPIVIRNSLLARVRSEVKSYRKKVLGPKPHPGQRKTIPAYCSVLIKQKTETKELNFESLGEYVKIHFLIYIRY